MSSFCYRVTQSVVRSLVRFVGEFPKERERERECFSMSFSLLYSLCTCTKICYLLNTSKEKKKNEAAAAAAVLLLILLLYTRINDVARQLQMWGATAIANKKETLVGVERKWLIALEPNPKEEKKREKKRNKKIGLDNLVKQFVLDAVNLQLAIFQSFLPELCVCWTCRQSAVTISFSHTDGRTDGLYFLTTRTAADSGGNEAPQRQTTFLCVANQVRGHSVTRD